MKTIILSLFGTLAAAFSAVLAPYPAEAPPLKPEIQEFTLAHAVPEDVFLFVGEKYRPERAFVHEYWEEVIESLQASGITEEVVGFFGTLLQTKDPELLSEMEKLKEKALGLIDAVDWEHLSNLESAFVERFHPVQRIVENQPPILMPDMVWIFRGSPESTAGNFEGLCGLLQGIVEEVNRAAGHEVLIPKRIDEGGLSKVVLDLTGSQPGAPSFPVILARQGDLILAGMRDHLMNDILALLQGEGKRPLAENPRFLEAYSNLPVPEDCLTFFDMQGLLQPIRSTLELLFQQVMSPGDTFENTAMPAEANALNSRALSAYQQGDFEKALALIRETYQVFPHSSNTLYNLACFNALVGNREEAIDWLAKAVEGGFYAPKKIAGDSDLTSLRGTKEFETVLKRAAELSAKHSAQDVAIHCAEEGEVFSLMMQVWQAYEAKDLELALKLARQAYALDPKDSKVLYALGCLHAVQGHKEEGLDFLARAVNAGFYCPKHISNDPDWKSACEDPRFAAAVAKAEEMAGKMSMSKEEIWGSVAMSIFDRIMNAVGLIDYIASVDRTEGYSTITETITRLVPDAQKRPAFALLGTKDQLTRFDRFLPQETSGFALSEGIDLNALYDFILDTVRLAGPPGEEALKNWEQMQQGLGFDIHKDLLDWFDGDSVSVTLAGDKGSVMLIEINDEKAAREKVSSLIELGTTKLTEMISKNPAFAGLAMLGMRTSPCRYEGLENFENLHFALSPQPAVWGVAEGHLVFGSSADAVALCLAAARGEHPSIRENPEVLSEALVPEGPFSGASLTDLRGMGKEMAAGLGMATMMSGMMSGFIPDPEVKPILAKISSLLGMAAPVVSEIDFFKSQASLTTFEGMQWRNRVVIHYFSPEERENEKQ